jgi:glycosyltransferase involved in cell wall biosynthesis
MKILNISHSFYPESSAGVEIYVDGLLRELSLDHEVMLFTRTREKVRAFSSSAQDYRIHAIPRKSTERRALKHFVNVLEQFSPDLVHIHHLMGLGLAIPRYLLSRNMPYVITLHDYWYVCGRVRLINRQGKGCNFPADDCGKCLYPDKTLKRLAYMLQKTTRKKRLLDVLNRAAWIVTPSKAMKQRYENFGIKNRNFSVQQLGIAAEVIPHPARVRTLSSDRKRIGYIGTLSLFKGVDLLIKAFGALKEECSLHLYGKMLKKDEAALRRLISNNVRITIHGEFDHRDILSVLGSVDIVVVPSVWEETHNIVVDEARAAGIPVIASAVGAIPDRIVDGKNGFLVPAGNAVALKEKIEEVIGDYQSIVSRLDFRMNLATIRENAAFYRQVYQDVVPTDRGRA